MSIKSANGRCYGALLGLFVAPAWVAPAWSAPHVAPDSIYVGTVVTMEAASPTAEAVAVKGDKIVAVGSRASVLALRAKSTRVVELGERALLPCFVDAHGHLTSTAAGLRTANLASPPAGPVKSIAELQETLRRYIAERHIAAGQWVVGTGYDDSLLAERRHPTRADLDAVSTEHPIFIVHVSGHLSVANSNLLARQKITADSPDPSGGLIRRQAGSHEPNGVLEESANMAVYAAAPRPGPQDALPTLSQALEYYASMGTTTVQDGAVTPDGLALLGEAARQHLLKLDVVAYRFWVPVGADFPDGLNFGQYVDRFKIGGIKLVLDGSPQGKTAYLTEPYLVPPLGQPATYRGYPSLPAGAVNKAVHAVISRGVPLLAHANGDAAAQMLIDAVDVARRETGQADSKVVMIHAQTVRDDQLDRMVSLKIIPSFFVGHTFYWGDWHRDQTLGVARAERISPAHAALERGLLYTLHNDSPVVPPDMIRLLWSATTRRTRSNDILGPQQRLSIEQAIAGITINAASQYSEEATKGSIKVGKLADFVILNRNPLAMDPEHLLELRVEETVSHGQSVYRRQ